MKIVLRHTRFLCMGMRRSYYLARFRLRFGVRSVVIYLRFSYYIIRLSINRTVSRIIVYNIIGTYLYTKYKTKNTWSKTEKVLSTGHHTRHILYYNIYSTTVPSCNSQCFRIIDINDRFIFFL